MSHEPPKAKLLKARSLMLKKVRSFFYKRNIWEADVPALIKYPNIDLHIDPVKTEEGHLHTSPEYCLKRLLSETGQSLFFLGHVYRKGEKGRLHNPEFTMIEYYRYLPFEDFIIEFLSLVRLFLKGIRLKKITYREAFKKYAKIDSLKASDDELLKLLKTNASKLNREEILNLILAEIIEPKLKSSRTLYMIYNFPASQGPFCKTFFDGQEEVAERFEFYFQGIEIANGYHELDDSREQEKRLKKIAKGKAIDPHFISALEGIGDCYGIALGFDRLLMLKLKETSLDKALLFSFQNL